MGSSSGPAVQEPELARRRALVLALPGAAAWWTLLVWSLAVSALIYGYGTSLVRLGEDNDGTEDAWARLGRMLFEATSVGLAIVGLLLAAPSLWRRPARLLAGPLVAYLAFVVARLLGSAFGSEPGWLRGLPFEVFFVVAASLVPPPAPDAWLRTIERALRVLFVWLTLVLVVFAYGDVVQRWYGEGYIPGFSKRLHGWLHANNLAALLFVYLAVLAQVGRDHGWRLRDVVNGLLALGLLAATQSKTTALLLALIGLWHLGTALVRARPLARLGAVVAALLAVAVLLTASLAAGRVSDAITERLEERRETLQTLTGRDQIWAITLEKWRENPWFGFGPLLWGPEMATRYRTQLGWNAPHAHNQFLQALGTAGLLGLVGLIGYLATLAWMSARHLATWPVAAYLVAYITLRGIFEVGIGHRQPANSTLLVLLLVHVTVLAVAAHRRPPAEERS